MRMFQLLIIIMITLATPTIVNATDNSSSTDWKQPIYQTWKNTNKKDNNRLIMGSANNKQSSYEYLFEAWKTARDKEIADGSCYSAPITAWPELCNIAKYGPAILPLVFRHLEEDITQNRMDSHLYADYGSLIRIITHKVFPKDEWAPGTFFDPTTETMMYFNWWKEGRRNSKQKFTNLYAKHKSLLLEKKVADDKDVIKHITSMGVEVMPFIIEQIRAGDDNLIPLVSSVMLDPIGGENPTRESVLKWWEEYKDYITIPAIPVKSTDGNVK